MIRTQNFNDILFFFFATNTIEPLSITVTRYPNYIEIKFKIISITREVSNCSTFNIILVSCRKTFMKLICLSIQKLCPVRTFYESFVAIF